MTKDLTSKGNSSTSNHWKTTIPFTYILDYSKDHVGNKIYYQKVAEVPPFFLHVGHDVVFDTDWGTAKDYSSGIPVLLTVEQVQERIKELNEYVYQLHQRGVKIVIPYINSQTLGGDHKTRSGFWKFYDNWEKYSSFGFGPKPKSDPVDWMKHDRRELEKWIPNYRYAPCVNHPDWTKFVLACVKNIADVGYDGVFVDNNDIQHYGIHCRKKFRDYLTSRYSQAELKRFFGTDQIEQLQMGGPGQGLLWAETQRFWSESSTEFLHKIRQQGRKVNPNFLVVPNLGPMAHLHGVWSRKSMGMDADIWSKACDLIMYEEMHQPGEMAPNIYYDHILQYKYAFACNFKGGMLSYNAQDSNSIALSMAEAGAGGGGCLMQAGYNSPSVRKCYANFWKKNASLFDKLDSYSSVGVTFFFDECYWDNFIHLRSVYRLSHYLSNNHVLFDFITRKNFNDKTLSCYKIIILPSVEHLSNSEISILRRYIQAGGICITAGSVGTFDQFGQKHSPDVLSSFLGDVEEDWNGVREKKIGKGTVIGSNNLSVFIPEKGFNLFDLKETEVNSIEAVYKAISQVIKYKGIEPQGKEKLLKYINRALKEKLEIVPNSVSPGVRFSAFWSSQKDKKIVLHVVNYNVPFKLPSQIIDKVKLPFTKDSTFVEGKPKVQKDIPIRLPLPVDWKVTQVRCFDPEEKDFTVLSYKVQDGYLQLNLPEINIYKVIEIRAN